MPPPRSWIAVICQRARRQVVGALDSQRSRPAEGLIAMAHPRDTKGRSRRT